MTAATEDLGPAVRALLAKTQQPNAALHIAAEYLDDANRQYALVFDEATDRTGPEWTLRCHLAQAYASIAILLHALYEHAEDQGTASDIAWELDTMTEDGQAVYDWLTDRLGELGVDPARKP